MPLVLAREAPWDPLLWKGTARLSGAPGLSRSDGGGGVSEETGACTGLSCQGPGGFRGLDQAAVRRRGEQEVRLEDRGHVTWGVLSPRAWPLQTAGAVPTPGPGRLVHDSGKVSPSARPCDMPALGSSRTCTLFPPSPDPRSLPPGFTPVMLPRPPLGETHQG